MTEIEPRQGPGRFSFPAIVAGLMVLWPIVALLGTQGMTPLLSLVAIAAVAFRPPMPRLSILLILFVLLVVWVSVSTLWSPAREGPVFSGNVADQNFAIEFSALRLLGIALATLVSIAALSASRGDPKRAGAWLASIFAVHLVMILITPPLLEPGLAVMYDTEIEAKRDGMQNVLRYANALALALSVILAVSWTRGGGYRIAGLIGALGATLVFAFLGSAAAILAVLLMLAFMGIVLALPKTGFRAIFTGLSAMVMGAPLLGYAARVVDQMDIALPLSFQSRIWAWQAVSERLVERPITGHGLEAASTWRESYTTRADWMAEVVARGGSEAAWSRYPLIPSHPHNMPLEIWAETGLVGAVLMAGTLFFLGLRLPSPKDMSLRLRLGTAGLTGATLAIASVSYSTWNEAFWSSVVLVALSLIIVSKAERP
ncbi:MAG: O-antigen ligase family protein [Pseudomonadota bacterium]